MYYMVKMDNTVLPLFPNPHKGKKNKLGKITFQDLSEAKAHLSINI